MRPLSSNLADEDKRPYFLWDDDISLREFKQRLRGPDPADRLQMLARLMRFLCSRGNSGGDRASGIS